MSGKSGLHTEYSVVTVNAFLTVLSSSDDSEYGGS